MSYLQEMNNPTDLGSRLNQGKLRYDLFPWADVRVDAHEPPPLDVIYDGLKIWLTGKPFKLELSIPRRELPGVVAVLTFGAAKYEPRGWEKGLLFSDTFASAARHAEAFLAGELLDRESGLPHQSHFWCNVLFLVVMTARGVGVDDRPAAHPTTRAKLDEMSAYFASLTGQGPASAAPHAGKGSN